MKNPSASFFKTNSPPLWRNLITTWTPGWWDRIPDALNKVGLTPNRTIQPIGSPAGRQGAPKIEKQYSCTRCPKMLPITGRRPQDVPKVPPLRPGEGLEKTSKFHQQLRSKCEVFGHGISLIFLSFTEGYSRVIRLFRKKWLSEKLYANIVPKIIQIELDWGMIFEVLVGFGKMLFFDAFWDG